MPLTLRWFSYRFAEQVINSRLYLKQEIQEVLTDPGIDPLSLSRPVFNRELEKRFVEKGWATQPMVFGEPGEPLAKMDFLKDRVGIEVEFGHASFIGIDLLKFQCSSYSELNKIDMGVYIVTTRAFQTRMRNQEQKQNWEGSLSFEKVQRYLPWFKSAIQVPICVVGIDVV